MSSRDSKGTMDRTLIEQLFQASKRANGLVSGERAVMSDDGVEALRVLAQTVQPLVTAADSRPLWLGDKSFVFVAEPDPLGAEGLAAAPGPKREPAFPCSGRDQDPVRWANWYLAREARHFVSLLSQGVLSLVRMLKGEQERARQLEARVADLEPAAADTAEKFMYKED